MTKNLGAKGREIQQHYPFPAPHPSLGLPISPGGVVYPTAVWCPKLFLTFSSTPQPSGHSALSPSVVWCRPRRTKDGCACPAASHGRAWRHSPSWQAQAAFRRSEFLTLPSPGAKHIPAWRLPSYLPLEIWGEDFPDPKQSLESDLTSGRRGNLAAVVM